MPTRPEALIAFLREHVLPTLEDELGEHLATALIESLTRGLHRKVSGFRAAIPAAPPSSRARVVRVGLRPRALLCHQDRFARVSLARHLLGGGFDVDVVESFTDVTTLTGPAPKVAVVSAGTSAIVLSAIAARFPELGLVVLGAPEPSRGRVERLDAKPSGPALLAAIDRLLVHAL